MNATQKIARLLRRLTGSFVYRKRLPKEFGGARIFVTSLSDIMLLVPGYPFYIFSHKVGASELFRVASTYIKPGDCVWDIGSNLGFFSFCASWKAGLGGIVFSLEADPYFVSLQHKSTRCLSIGYAPVVPLCAAAADKMAVLELAIPRTGHARNHLTLVQGNATEGTEFTKQVISVTADFLLEYWKFPDIVKVDIEGSELMFLSGGCRLLQEVRPVFYIEVSEPNLEAATAIFCHNGYKLFSFSSGQKIKEIEKCQFNTLAKPAEKC